MDELLYLIALVAGFAGAFGLWRYSRTRKRALARTIRKQNEPKNNE